MNTGNRKFCKRKERCEQKFIKGFRNSNKDMFYSICCSIERCNFQTHIPIKQNPIRY